MKNSHWGPPKIIYIYIFIILYIYLAGRKGGKNAEGNTEGNTWGMGGGFLCTSYYYEMRNQEPMKG